MDRFSNFGSSKPSSSEIRPAIDDYDGIEVLNFEGSKGSKGSSNGAGKKPKKQALIEDGKRQVPEFFEMLMNHEDFDPESERLSTGIRQQLEKYKQGAKYAQKPLEPSEAETKNVKNKLKEEMTGANAGGNAGANAGGNPGVTGGTLEFVNTDFKKMKTSDLRDQYDKCKGEARAGNNNEQVAKRLIAIAEELVHRNLLSAKKLDLLREEFNING